MSGRHHRPASICYTKGVTPSLRIPFVVVATFACLAAACGGAEEAEPAASSVAESDAGIGEVVDEDSSETPERDGSFDEPVTVIVPNSPGTLTVGRPQRVMTALVGQGPNDFLGGPEQPVTVSFSMPDGDDDEVGGEVDGQWLTTDASALGLYVSFFEFPRSGLWEVRVSADGQDLGGAAVQVGDESSVPNVGDNAPLTESPTASTPDEIAAISTDPDPEPLFYEQSIADAVTNGRPTVIVFATPAFCQTALCGPTIEFVKGATAERAGVDVVHVEPFDLELAPQGTLQPIPSMEEWGLVTEPWVFIVDDEGLVAATFEGIVGRGELDDALDEL